MTSREFILGGQRSGKSRAAEARAAAWLAADARHEAALIATAWAGDDEMAARIARHQADRRERVPRLRTVEATEALGAALGEALARQSAPERLVVVDCLTLWLTQCRMPPPDWPHGPIDADAAEDALLDALAAAPGPVVLVSNEIGLGLAPLGREARDVVDALGRLHQRVAARCERVTLMVAGCALAIKGGPEGAR